MLKAFSYSLFVLFTLLSIQIHAKTLKLAPKEVKLLANKTPWTLNATCNVLGTHQGTSKVRIVVLKNKGIINGKNLSTGEGTSFKIKGNGVFSFSADSGAQINLINLSSDQLEATCSI
jgi:hypothetical protein